jgi:hypothetical protein
MLGWPQRLWGGSDRWMLGWGSFEDISFDGRLMQVGRLVTEMVTICVKKQLVDISKKNANFCTTENEPKSECLENQRNGV